MKLNRKAITPLMATILLISFAVAVGVVVMNLGKAQVEEEAQCPIEIGLKFSVIAGQEQYCYDAAKKELRFTIENGINIKVEGLIVNLIGSEQATSLELNEAKLIKAGSYVGRSSFDTVSSGALQQLKITPKVVLYDAEQICTEQALMVENVPNC